MPIQKYRVYVTEIIERSTSYTLPISSTEVIEHFSLEGAAAKDWEDKVEEYVGDKWHELSRRKDTYQHDTDDNPTGDEEIENVEKV